MLKTTTQENRTQCHHISPKM